MTTIGIIAAGEVGSQLAYPDKPADHLPVEELAGKVVLDTNNYLASLRKGQQIGSAPTTPTAA